ncbi:MAG: tRNA dihydrouridine synthase DusB [Candidatus Omnitrophica bacterium]|nr:tRNA dihydrouridine synthase DusB [Candidatus Omnitrophota bacterium]
MSESIFKNVLILAPMEDVTDHPFRVICRELGADIVYTEFTSSEALIRSVPKALDKIKFSENERPIGIQIFGFDPVSCVRAAGICESFSPDFIDLNCGCPVKKHVARGEGSGLLKDLDRLEMLVRELARATSLPVTVKTRLGWDHDHIVIEELARRVEQAGASALVLHCRTRAQMYRGQADWSWLGKIRPLISIPLIGNGDVLTPRDVKTLFDMGCDGVMIGRGAIYNPWIFQQSRHFLETGELLQEPTVDEKIHLCVRHLIAAQEYKGNHNFIFPFRKYYVGYLKGLPRVAKLRSDLMRMTDVEDIKRRLYQFLDQCHQG